MDDSRLNVGLACTAALAGAAVMNHAAAVDLRVDGDSGRVVGARIQDKLTVFILCLSTDAGKAFDVYAEVVVNATGPFCDAVRKMANSDAPNMISPNTLAGTTDSAASVNSLPEPTKEEIDFILQAIGDYLNIQVRHSDILSSWSGLRPLALDPSAKNTESISRDHIVHIDCPGLITISGGKWTTYLSMAEDAVDAAIKHGNLKPSNACVTSHLPILGAYKWEPSSFTTLAQSCVRMKRTRNGKVIPGTMDASVAKHLSSSYGSMAEQVALIAQDENLGKRLAHGYPYLEAEVAYCVRNEYCESAIDFIARRTRLAFLDVNAAAQALPRIIQVLATERGWNGERLERERMDAEGFLQTFKTVKMLPS
ncbi:hypothetical protein QJS04_geneDACA025100 [Acorus gramineus]|uniref:glycerol-3-phosphate dehydrogenase n=1 Tax=Acorus gramineus TaxID=55184 RepID=A0AAV8ZWX3_ACOGR|nr:hypothetical protein QJS04_geneDACA025100 [Acorus gramineus]